MAAHEFAAADHGNDGTLDKNEYLAVIEKRFKPADRDNDMTFLHAFGVGDFVDTLISLSAAFVLGTPIGAERQHRRRGGG